MSKKILVILGGTSKEREVSLETGKSCIKALKKIGYRVKKFDPKIKKNYAKKILTSKYPLNPSMNITKLKKILK